MSAASFVSAYEQLAEIEQKSAHNLPNDLAKWWVNQFNLERFADMAVLDLTDAPQHRADISLFVTDQLAHWLIHHRCFDENYWQAVSPYLWLFAVAGANKTPSWLHASHAINVTFDQLLRFGRSFQPNPSSTEMLTSLASAIRNAATAAVMGNDGAVQLALKAIQSLIHAERQRIAGSDRQLLAKELHLLRTTHVNSAVTRAIRFAMHGKSPHAKILAFIDEVWRKYLSVIYLRVGLENEEWECAMADIDMMLWLSDGATVEDIKRALDFDVAKLVDRLHKASHSIRGVDQLVEQFIEWFTDMVASRAAELPIEVDFGLNLDSSALSLTTMSFQSSSTLTDEETLLQQLRLTHAGDAVQIKTFEGWKRARFIDVDLAHDVFLIGDNHGNRLAALGRCEVASNVQAGKMALVDNSDFFSLIEMPLALVVEKWALQWRDDYMAKLDEQKREQEAKLLAELESRRQREAEARAARVAAARAQADYEQRVQHCKELAKRLRAGAMVQIECEDGKWRPGFLAMISGGDGHYVFVERNGRRLANLSLSDVITAMVENRLNVIESGSALDATLSNMVKERRQFLKEEGAA